MIDAAPEGALPEGALPDGGLRDGGLPMSGLPDSGPKNGPPDGPEQLALMPSPRRLFAATPSRLMTFDCPRRYRMTYVDRPVLPKGPPWAHNSIGAAVHVALARWWSLPAERRTPDSGAALVDRAWQHDGFANEEQSDRWLDRAREWVRQYLHDEQRRDSSGAEPRGVERTVAFRTNALAISGRVDRIDERDGELVIVDYKTGRAALTDDDASGSLALALYAIAAARTLHKPCRVVELHHVPSGAVATYEHGKESLQRQLHRAEQTATDIQAAVDTLAAGAEPDQVFPPNPGPACSWCDYRRHCADGQRAAASRRSWDGLPAEPVS